MKNNIKLVILVVICTILYANNSFGGYLSDNQATTHESRLYQEFDTHGFSMFYKK